MMRYCLALLSLTLTGCGLFGPPYPEPEHVYTMGDFACPSIGSVGGVEITLNKCVDASRFKQGVFVRMHIQSRNEAPYIQNVVLQNFERLNFFENVYYREPTIYINAHAPKPRKINGELWFEHDDPYATNQIRDWYGEGVLIADVTLLDHDPNDAIGSDASFLLNLIDPHDGATIMMLRSEGGGWMGYDRTVMNPAFTVIKKWVTQSPKTGGRVWR